jgi:hypothetical protein
MSFPGWWAIFPTVGAVLIISAGMQSWFNRTILSNCVLVWFGLISFPLYLWHWPLLSFARIIGSDIPSRKIRIAAIVISIVLAWLTYKLIEKPIRFGKYSKAKTISLLILMIAVGYAGYNCYKQDGFGFRFPKIVQELTSKYDFQKVYRAGTCFLYDDQDFSAHNSCKLESEGDKKPSILLWGDSHAAHLYSGYKTFFGEKFEIIQRNAAGCPPILNMEIVIHPHCKEINDHVFELIKIKKPEKVVLAAIWTHYDWKKIEETISQLRKIGITDINLIGPVPQWNESLQKLLYLTFKSDELHRVPKRMKFGVNQNFIQLDSLMSDFSSQLKVNYISPKNIFCNEQGCLTRFGDTADTLTTWDSSHLTEIGSKFLVSHFPKN